MFQTELNFLSGGISNDNILTLLLCWLKMSESYLIFFQLVTLKT